jgi:TatA/E family protein of Tat protein translocase
VFNIGSQELLVVLFLVFIFFGPRHIPGVAKALGKGMGDVQRAVRGVEDSMRRAADDIPKGVEISGDPVIPKALPAAGAIKRGEMSVTPAGVIGPAERSVASDARGPTLDEPLAAGDDSPQGSA